MFNEMMKSGRRRLLFRTKKWERRQTMKKTILVLGLSLAISTFLGANGFSQESKEVSEQITTTWHFTPKVLALGEGRSFTISEGYGIIIGEDGKGLFHEATARASAAYLMEKGVSQNYIGYICYFLKSGDRVFTTFTAEIKAGAPTKGKATILGGTGNCAGIQGNWEYTGNPLRPAAEGILQSYNKITIKYKLP
jgi:hypothetical protein